MLFDFHTHGKLAKKLPFSTAYTDWLFGEARRAGLDGLCLTEHFNTLQFEDLYGYLASMSQRTGDCLVLENGLRVFPGMETDVAECGHILSIGPMEAILELNRRLAPTRSGGTSLLWPSCWICLRNTRCWWAAAIPTGRRAMCRSSPWNSCAASRFWT